MTRCAAGGGDRGRGWWHRSLRPRWRLQQQRGTGEGGEGASTRDTSHTHTHCTIRTAQRKQKPLGGNRKNGTKWRRTRGDDTHTQRHTDTESQTRTDKEREREDSAQTDAAVARCTRGGEGGNVVGDRDTRWASCSRRLRGCVYVRLCTCVRVIVWVWACSVPVEEVIKENCVGGGRQAGDR